MAWSSPDFADTFEKVHNGVGGVSWKSGGHSVGNSNKKPFNFRVRGERSSPK